jgi:positive regulator of sigma E activity
MDLTFIAAIVVFLLPLVVILILYLLRKRLGREAERRG